MTMRIYLFRHGEAAAKDDPSISSDPERPLVPEGIRKTQLAAEGLKRMGVPVDLILTSPWKRARQTADVVEQVLGMSGSVQEMEELAGDCSVEDVLRGLGRHADREHLMLVGHQPLLGDVAAYLLTLAAGMQVDLKKSGVCAVEVERLPPKRPGALLWMFTPKQLKLLR